MARKILSSALLLDEMKRQTMHTVDQRCAIREADFVDGWHTLFWCQEQRLSRPSVGQGFLLLQPASARLAATGANRILAVAHLLPSAMQIHGNARHLGTGTLPAQRSRSVCRFARAIRTVARLTPHIAASSFSEANCSPGSQGPFSDAFSQSVLDLIEEGLSLSMMVLITATRGIVRRLSSYWEHPTTPRKTCHAQQARLRTNGSHGLSSRMPITIRSPAFMPAARVLVVCARRRLI